MFHEWLVSANAGLTNLPTTFWSPDPVAWCMGHFTGEKLLHLSKKKVACGTHFTKDILGMNVILPFRMRWEFFLDLCPVWMEVHALFRHFFLCFKHWIFVVVLDTKAFDDKQLIHMLDYNEIAALIWSISMTQFNFWDQFNKQQRLLT